MMQPINGYRKEFNHGDCEGLYFVAFTNTSEKIDGVDYFFKGFFNSGKYDVKEVICLVVDKSLVRHVWYKKKVTHQNLVK